MYSFLLLIFCILILFPFAGLHSFLLLLCTFSLSCKSNKFNPSLCYNQYKLYAGYNIRKRISQFLVQLKLSENNFLTAFPIAIMTFV